MSELTPTAFGVLVNLRERYQDSDPEVAMLLDAIEMLDEADRAHLLSKVEDLIYRRDHVSMETSIT